ncbi:aldehyde dehydrogenase [Gordonia sp. DT30]|uniref:aldehyde dehydrogenase n=1 Tax=Gordonia sp. DT30 TaxID=3416546 RepID=UPI003CEF2152
MPTDSLFIDGKWRSSQGTDVISVISPSTGLEIGVAADATADDVAAAVAAARNAFDHGSWRHLEMSERVAVVTRAADTLTQRIDEISALVTSEMGVPITLSTAIQTRTVDSMHFLCELAFRTKLQDVRSDGGSTAVVREPVGVVASIAPWNGPFAMAVNKIVTPILAGCAVVFKPAPETPFDVAPLVDALQAAGLPDGVLNVVTGGAATGQALVDSPEIDKVSFTGSTAAGRAIASVCGQNLKGVQLELGGKSAAIVLEDADINTFRAGISKGCFMNSGQVCVALSRVLAPRSRYDEVVQALVAAAGDWKTGDPFDSATTLGPLVTERQRDRVESYVALGIKEGARLVTGGRRPADLDTGWFVEPTVFADVDNSMRIAREEIFGPVVVVIPYDTEADAIAMANDSDYGLHGAVFTEDLDRAAKVAASIRTGTFSINNYVYNNRAPFGGVKASGIGRDSGQEGFESFFELKTINLAPGMEGLYQDSSERSKTHASQTI